ncbi:MAG TPA: branched-chain amino acid aminotransferase [Chitinophagaceae bacterium]|nr:branched-chain amino acid aminotransferase [Chitinophagaceae bacterium]
MEITTDFIVRKSTHSRLNEVDFTKLEFGKYISDHMLVCDYYHKEWQTPQIVPFENLSISPAALALHYGQTVFEGMKAFRMDDGRINIFRIHKHYERFARSLDRMCMAIPPKEIFEEGLMKLIEIDKAWVPSQPESALYLRPFVFATEARFGVKISEEFRFIVFTGPVGKLYTRPIKVKVETEYTRAAKGGTGFTKCGGNYGASFYPTQKAREEGYDQVLWTDGRDHEYIEESGMMNVMFVIDSVIITPALSDTILDGVTRDSFLQLARENGYKVEERPVSISELEKAFRKNTIAEAAGIGTAAVVLPIGTIGINGTDFHLPQYSHENIFLKLKKHLEDIRSGRANDIYGWNSIV